jgi:hypothetical protein
MGITNIMYFSWSPNMSSQEKREKHSNVPGLSAGLHVVGERDIVGPDVVLPLPEAEDAAEDAPEWRPTRMLSSTSVASTTDLIKKIFF